LDNLSEMPAIETSRKSGHERGEIAKFALAFAVIYLVWGSTYLAIRVVVASMPPLLAAGIRFVLAGTLLYAWARFRGGAAPSRREWKSVLIIGALMFFGCYGCLFWAEQTLPSGLAAVLVAMLPLWTLVLEVLFLRTQRLTPPLCLGLVLGFAGVVVISGRGTTGAQLLPALIVIASNLCWAIGSILSKRLELPRALSVSAGAQMMAGGWMLLLASLVSGEWRAAMAPSANAVLGLIYLIVAGSIAAFSAYVWLLHRMGPTRVSSYAYVNPVIALALGYFFGGERFQRAAILGSLLVLASVVLILSRRNAARGAK
jgi:drug/metabolite transporter (DMT)-like permease